MRSPDFFSRGGRAAGRRSSDATLAIGAAAAECRTLGEHLAVVFIVAARTLGKPIRRSRLAARMLLPGVALLARTIEFRTVVAASRGPRKPRTLVAARLARLVVTGLVEARLVEIPRAVARRTGIGRASSRGPASRFCHGLESPRSPGRWPRSRRSPKSLRGPRSGAPRENFLSPPNFRSPCADDRAVRTIALRPVAVFAKTFAARRVGPLLATAIARGIGLLVAEFPVGKSRRRAGIAALAARGVGTLFAARAIIRG